MTASRDTAIMTAAVLLPLSYLHGITQLDLHGRCGAGTPAFLLPECLSSLHRLEVLSIAYQSDAVMAELFQALASLP